MTEPLLAPAALDQLRTAVDGFTVDTVAQLLGPVGQAAHQRGDLAGVARSLPDHDPLASLVRLFLLGEDVAEPVARDALRPLEPAAAPELVRVLDGRVRARIELRPHASQSAEHTADWWVVSDFGSDVRPGPLAADHVLGIGAAALTLAQATPRRPVSRALDLGTGSGVQALYLAEHADTVVATDVSARALRFAATTAALSGRRIELRRGSLVEPVAGERFGLVVANPPFVVSPGLRADTGGYDYRDSGLAGDAVSAALVRDLPGLLEPDGSASLLANWIVPADGDWVGRVGGWLEGSSCDAWVWQREVADPGEYVSLWLRDAGEVPGTARWRERYDAWLDWFAANQVAAIGMGLVTMWRNDDGPVSVVCEDVPQPVEQPVGPYLADWVGWCRWLAATADDELLSACLRRGDDVVRVRQDVPAPSGWATELARLQQRRGVRWDVEVDDAIAALVAACDGATPLAVPIGILAAVHGRGMDEMVAAVLPVVRDLVGRGFLEPPS